MPVTLRAPLCQLISFFDGVKGLVDGGNAVGIIYLDYAQGKSLVMADTLSRHPNQEIDSSEAMDDINAPE